jgi:hypothetical protein
LNRTEHEKRITKLVGAIAGLFKLTVDLPVNVHRDLVAYGDLHAHETG